MRNRQPSASPMIPNVREATPQRSESTSNDENPSESRRIENNGASPKVEDDNAA